MSAQPEQQQPMFNIEKLYIKDISLEVPNAPQIFLEQTQPQIEIQLQKSSTAMDDDYYEASLMVTVTAKIGDKTMFLAEVRQAGVFQLRNFSPADIELLVNIGCPNVLFPYAREAISDIILRAGFVPVLLNPVNFEALYQEEQRKKNEAAPATH